MHEQLLTSVLSDLNRSSIDITASAVISTDGLPIAHILPNNVDADRVGAMSAALLALGNRTIHELLCGELEQVIVKGTAEVTRGDEVILLTENQSVYIPLGEKHRLHNVGRIPLELIEVQTGSYLEEDDIVRYQDNFGRC